MEDHSVLAATCTKGRPISSLSSYDTPLSLWMGFPGAGIICDQVGDNCCYPSLASGKQRGEWCLSAPRISSSSVFCADVREAALPRKSQRQPQVGLKIALHARQREWGSAGGGAWPATLKTFLLPVNTLPLSQLKIPEGRRASIPLGFCRPFCFIGDFQ